MKKPSHRDEKLDALLGKKVYLIFFDKTEAIGILGWQDEFNPQIGWLPYRYYIITDNGLHLSFRKSHVIYIREIKDE